MQFNPDQCQPTVDMLTLSVKYDSSFFQLAARDWERYRKMLERKFADFRSVIESSIGRPLQVVRDSKKSESRWHVPGYGIYLTAPSSDTWGCGRVYFQPTRERLACLQSWLHTILGYDLNDIVTLFSVELTFDIFCPGLSFEGHEALVLRLGSVLAPRHTPYSFAVGIIGERKRCNDGAVNGSVTVYLQSCHASDREQSSDELDRNLKASSHGKIYAKEMARQSFVRVENTVNGRKAANLGIKLNPNDLPALLDLPSLQFSKFFDCRTADIDGFKQDFEAIQVKSFAEKVRKHAYMSLCMEYLDLDHEFMPVVDKMRMMKCAVRGGNPKPRKRGEPERKHNKLRRKLEDKLEDFIKKIPFEQAINTPLPEDFYIAQRMGRHALPDDSDLPERIELQGFVHKPFTGVPEPKKPEVTPVQLSLPLLEQAKTAQNRKILALSGTICQNPTIRTGQAEKCSQSDFRAAFEAGAVRGRNGIRGGVP